MENSLFDVEEEAGNKENSLQKSIKDMEVASNARFSKTLIKRVNPENVDAKKSQTRKDCFHESHLQAVLGFKNRIPKQIVSVDEKYLRRCLEFIYATAFNGIPAKLASPKTGFSMNCSSTYSCNVASFIVGCPLVAGAENGFVSPVEDFVGKITRSKSMMNIIRSPVFHQFGALDSIAESGRTNLIDCSGEIHSNFVSSPGGLSITTSHTLENEPVILGTPSYISEPSHKRFVSVSSTNTTCSDQSSSSFSAASTQGMLHFTSKAGVPHFVFSVDERNDVYVANCFKAASPNNKVFDCVYLFHSTTGSKKENNLSENESDLVGKMTVRTSLTVCPQNSEVMETEFLLYGSDDNSGTEKKTPSHVPRKNKRLSKKVVEVFKTSHHSKQRSSSKFRGTSELPEFFSTNPSESDDLDMLGGANLWDNHLPPNGELAAISVKEHVRNDHQEVGVGVGGWGLKFLKNVGIRQKASVASSECCVRNSGDCSTSIDVLVPSGFHGGPRTRNGGPSGLVERWRSGGHCDCGGWDIGCPLTVLNARPINKEDEFPSDSGSNESFDLFIQGSKQDGSVMKLANVRDGLYIVHFQSTLSALQCFSIAVAIVHARNPLLRSKLYRR